MTLAEVIAQLDDLPRKSTIYTESLAPWASAYVADDSARSDESLPYAFSVAAAQAAIGRRRAVLSRRA